MPGACAVTTSDCESNSLAQMLITRGLEQVSNITYLYIRSLRGRNKFFSSLEETMSVSSVLQKQEQQQQLSSER